MQNMRFFLRAGTLFQVVTIVALGYTTANAQFSSTTSIMNTFISGSKSFLIADSSLYQGRADAARAGGRSSAGGSGATAPQPPPRQYPITATDFKPVGGYLLPDEMAKASPNLKPEEREAMLSMYNSILSSFEREARKNNMANAFAFVLGTSIQVFDGKELSDAYVNNLIGYYNSRLATNPQFAAMPGQQKQAVYESLVLTGGIIAYLDAQGKQTNNAAMLSQARDMSRTMIKQLTGIEAK